MSRLFDTLETYLQAHYPRIDTFVEIDETFSIHLPNVKLNVSADEEMALIIETIRVRECFQRVGLGIGTKLVTHLISYTEEEGVVLQANNVDPNAIGFWEQPALGFARLSAYKNRWQRVPAPATLCLMEVATNRRRAHS